MSKGKQELDPAVASGDAQLEELWMAVGAINAVDSIASSLASQTIRNLQRIRDQKLYVLLGFHRFEDFLDSERSRINYAKFNRLEKAMEREGDDLFDYLSAIDAPLSKRKLLGKGDVAIEGKEIVAQVGEEEIRIPLNNQTRILGVLSRLVEKRNEQARKIRRGEARVNALKEEVAELKSGGSHAGSQGGFFDAQLNLIGSFTVLAAEVEKLPEDQRKEQRKKVYDTIAEHMKRLDEAFGLQVTESVKKRAAAGGRVPAHLLEDDED